MNGYILLMHNDVLDTGETNYSWDSYLNKLRESGSLSGGSAIGEGICVNKAGLASPITAHLAGYIIVQAMNLNEAKKLVAGNPVFEAGGTVEIRELPRTN
jgi:hypothetical protein